MTTPLLPLLPPVYDILFNFAQSDGFWANLETAFGTSYDVVKATQLRQQWQSRNFGQLPPIEVLSDEVLGTANGAYSSSTNKIYLSASFLNTASSAAIVNVILEEIGHYVDAQINQVDSAGDEGAIFAELVQGNSIDIGTLQVLQAEDDSGIITINGEVITVENSVTPSTGLNALLNETGKIYLSVDGNGTSSSTGFVQVLKKSGATVRKAYLIGDGVNSIATSASVNGTAISWDRIESTPWGGGTFYSYFRDVTSLVQSTIDAASAGTLNIAVDEGTESPSYEGLVLAVVFNDPNQTVDNSVILYFGGLNPTGGTATINFASPVNTSSTLAATLGLAIGYSYNDSSSTQTSQVKVNGQSLTSVAGNYDDSAGYNGALFTVGGLGDSLNNPSPSGTDVTTDDELYNLLPFIQNGDASITLNTVNPSNDDHIFFAHLTLQGITGTDSTNVVTLAIAPTSVNEDGTANLVYTFTRSGVTTNALTVNYTVGGTATFSTDYTQTGAASFTTTTGTVTFAANSSTATVTIDPTADTTIESDETVALTLTSWTGYAVGTTTAVTGTITNDDFPSITLAVSPASVTEDGTTNLVYTFTRTGVTTNALTANYTVGGTATFNTDYTQTGAASYTATTGTVTFAAGSSTATVTVDPTADTTVETDETVILTLASGTGYTVGTTTPVTGTITNDDFPSITLAVSPSSVTEDGTTNLIYTFTRTGVTTNALTVNYTIGGTATLNTDYTRTGTTNTVTFAANATTATVTVDPTADTTVEPDETVILTLATGTGYTIGTPNAATGTITNDDTSVTLAVSPASVTEDGTTNLVYTFTRTGVTTNALTVNYTLGGTATLNTDYTRTGTTNTVTFAAGSSTATVTVDPTADTTVESDETVILTLATGTGYTVGTTTAVTGTITNDDTSVTLAVSPSSVTEDGTTNLVYTFTRTGVTTNALTVNYTLGGTATLNTDYTRTGTTNTVTFAAGSSTATVTVDPTPDTIVESNETVILTLATGTGYTVGTTTPVTGTITNDDVTLPSITLTVSPSPSSVTEDGTTNLTYIFTRTGSTTNPLTVNYTVGGTATFNTDYTQSSAASYTATTGTVTFAAGSSTATVAIDPTADTTVESDETVILTLATGTGYTVGTPNAATGTITNDDLSQLSINDITVVEGQNSNAILTVTVNNPNAQPITVNYTTTPIDATANVDYTSKTGTITIAPNTSTATISIPILNDNLNEPDEAFTVTLSNPVNATINPDEAIGQVIITDTLQSAITRTLPTNVENLRLIGSNNINGTGNAGDNKITGNSGNNILAGANGNDIYCFNASTPLGSDTIQETTTGGIDTLDFTGTNTAVRVNLGITTNQTVVTNNLKLTFSANNTIENIISDSGNDRLTGNSLNNTLTGGGGNDQLTGQDGNDSLIGGSGDDLLTGGNGSDNFIFNSSNLGIDAISDFTPGSDKIVLSKAIFTALQSIIGNGFSQAAEFASVDDDDLVATSSAFIVYSTGSGSIYYNQNGSAAGLGSGSEFANLLTVPTLIATDFALIN
ncbi:Calx-beta domain-containing protein [Microcystis aeruginosa CS-564/01]|uniref:beta strand repeat-containing protein n=1 Tax=Microcystis aeruginosa TaxID=1126 RepID=UPI00232B34C9|nr:Calx-beta domain-containing protein [Microcystis aeruginosa]MDB9426277.1 Calx-beta domain-containing protein [Microcystis aeruginosa CS-564/01]